MTQLKRWCVTVNDNWTPMRTFWFCDNAIKFWDQQPFGAATIYVWRNGKWQKF